MLLEKHLDLKPKKMTTGSRLIPLANHYKSSQAPQKVARRAIYFTKNS